MQKVGKLNSSIDIIPLQGSSGDYKSKTMNNKHKIDSSHKFLRDKLLISRVQTYMHENENKVYIDVNEMADALQKKYKDYRIKKRGPFRALVRKAYDELTEMFAKKYCSREWPTYDDEDEEEEVDVESDPQNTMLDGMLLKMYKKSQNKQNGNSSDKELIDISSDDDVNKMESNSRKASEPEVVENLQQKPGPSSSTEKTTHAKEIEQLRRPSKEIQQTTTTSTTTTTTTTSTTIESAKKRQRDEDADCQFTFVRKTKGIPISDPKITFSDIRGNDKTKRIPISEPKITFSDIGGNDKVLKTVCKLLAHMKHPEIFKELGISPPRGFLLHGPPGCGKTLLAHAIAGELGIPLLKVAAPELVTGVSGESEARIRELFEQALAIAPCVIFLDEIDSVAPHRATAQREMERRIVAQLLSCLDELSLKENGTRVLVLGATNRPDSLDPALRRAGRFDHEVCLGIPDRDARAKILAVHTEKVALSPNVSLSTIASLTPGFVGADLVALIREAAMAAVDRILENLKSVPDNKSSEIPENNTVIEKKTENFENSGNLVDEVTIEPSTSDQNVPKSESSQTTLEMDVIQENSKSPDLTGLLTWLRNDPPLPTEQLSNLCIEHSDFETALRIIQPSAKREGFATVPDVTWDDVGSLRDIREELQMAILAPIRHSEHFTALGLTTPTGVLLCGPPGCGKTLLAKAIANEAGINFISVKGPELLNMYIGESEKAVRQCFIRARNSAPCVIFFDELDALCPRRSEGDNSATSRVVNQMLTEMDGVEGRQGVFLMAASNRPDIIDPAVLRPGRLDKILYVDLPTSADRVDILRALTKNATKPKLAADVNLEEIGYNSKCDGYTGADLAALIREAGIEALRELMDMHYSGQPEISMRHIVVAFDKIRPSVQEKDIKHYEKLKRLYSIKKKSDDTPMETPIDTPIVDVVMEPMDALLNVYPHLSNNVVVKSSNNKVTEICNVEIKTKFSTKEKLKNKSMKCADRDHITIIPGIPEKYKCNICSKIFQNKKGKCYHDACITGVKPYQCSFCDRSFIKRSHFEYHERIHKGYRPYKCNLCEKAFPQQNKLNRHMYSHGDKQFICSKCDKRYSKQDDLKNHLHVHNGTTTYSCKTCEKTFRMLTNLKRHLKTHNNERPYVCDQCNKSFKDKSLVIRHKKTHGKDRPFSCAHCSRVFLSKSELRRHLTVHSDEKPFSCKYCDTVFRRKDNLHRHIRHHHPESLSFNINNEQNANTETDTKLTKTKQINLKQKQKTKKTQKMPSNLLPKTPTKVSVVCISSCDQISSRLDSMGNITPVIRTTNEVSNAVSVINGPINIKKLDDKSDTKRKTFTYTEPIPLAEAVVINKRIEEKLYPQNISNHNYFLRNCLNCTDKSYPTLTNQISHTNSI